MTAIDSEQIPQGLEQAPETFVEKIKETLTEVAQKVAAEAKELKGEVVAEVKKVVLELETEDKLLVTATENAFLKLQVELQQHNAEITRIQNLGKEVSDKFKSIVDGLFVKYGRNIKEEILDVTEHKFKPRPKTN